MDIGDIYAIAIPSTNGHEQAGYRPAIIVQTPKFEEQLSTALIIPLTSQLGAQTFPGTFLIHPDTDNGLTTDSVALVFQLRAIDKKRIRRRLGRLNDSHLAELYQLVKTLMQLP